MSIEWITTESSFEFDENSNVNEEFFYNAPTAKFSILSSTLPEQLVVQHIRERNSFTIRGYVPQVNKDMVYYLSVRLADYDYVSNKVIDFKDKYIEIHAKNLPVKWDESQETEFTATTYLDFEETLKLKNGNGNEFFKKVDGELPIGINLAPNGKLFGNTADYNELKPFVFTISLFVDNKEINPDLRKTFTLKVNKIDNNNPPVWVTKEGLLDSLKYLEESKCRVVAYDPSYLANEGYGNVHIGYRLDESLSLEGLPDGLSLNSNTGEITGVVKTLQTGIWRFGVKAYKVFGTSDRIEMEKAGIFSISLNEVSKEHIIDWGDSDSLELGNFFIGKSFHGDILKASVNDGEIINYRLGQGNIPEGLMITPDGKLDGYAEFNDLDGNKSKEYKFTIIASTRYSTATKNVSLILNKGLGKEARDLYLRINLDYKDQYNDIKTQLNTNAIYNTKSGKYIVSPFPIINVATLTCYDRELLSYILKFGNPEIVRFKDTRIKNFIKVDDDGSLIDSYDACYKAVDESTYQWDKLKVGNYDFKQKLEDMKEEIPPQIDQNAKLDFNNRYYDSNANIDANYRTDPHVTYPVFNFKNVRQLLTQRIYVKKLIGEYRYDEGSHQLLMGGIDSYYPVNITNPWCFDNENNTLHLKGFPEGGILVLPDITDDDIRYDDNKPEDLSKYIQLLDPEQEDLPEWKRKSPIVWEADTVYNAGNVIINNNEYYLCKQTFKTLKTFTYDENVLQKIKSNELDVYLPKEYFPTLDIGYYKSNQNIKYLRDLNNREKENGEFWYNKDFLFYEMISQPLFKDEEPIGIPFFNFERKYPDKIKLKKFQINCLTPDAIVEIVSDPYVIPYNNTIYVEAGTVVSYEVSKAKHLTVKDSYPIINSEVLDIELKKKVKYEIHPKPSTATVRMKIDGKVTEGNSVITYEGANVEYTITLDKYVTIHGNDKVVIKEIGDENAYSCIRNFVLTPLYTLTIKPSIGITEAKDAVVTFTVDGKVVNPNKENSTTQPKDTYIRYSVKLLGYTTVYGEILLQKDEIIPISLNENDVTITVNPTPADSKVTLRCVKGTGETIIPQEGNSIVVTANSTVIYIVEKNGYVTFEGRKERVQRNDDSNVIEVKLLQYITYRAGRILEKGTQKEIVGATVEFSISPTKKGSEITAPENVTVSYSIKKFGYVSESGLATEKDYPIINGVKTIDFYLEDKKYFIFETNDNDGFIPEYITRDESELINDETFADYFGLEESK